MDLTTGWDFNKEEDRLRAEKLIDEQEPLVLIGSPPCVAFSQLQSLIPDSQRKAKQLAEGIRHMEFMAKLYKKQVEAGRLFLHENPAHAKSWALPCIKKVMREHALPDPDTIEEQPALSKRAQKRARGERIAEKNVGVGVARGAVGTGNAIETGLPDQFGYVGEPLRMAWYEH